MGFEHVLSLKIEKIPKKLGYWLVTNYEPETSSLNINGMSLLITKEVIHDVYGVPIGEVPIIGFKKSRKRDNVIEEWKRQIVIKKMVLVNQSILANIEGDTVIHNLDWCSYTLDCLNESRKAWNRQRKEIKNGRFRKVIFSPNVQFLDDVEIVEAKNYEVAEKKVDTPITTENTNTNAPSFGTCKEMMHESQSDMIILESSLSKASMKEAECKYKRLQPINIHFSEDGDEANGGVLPQSSTFRHFYYITFNLMKDEVHVIDNLTVCPNYKELHREIAFFTETHIICKECLEEEEELKYEPLNAQKRYASTQPTIPIEEVAATGWGEEFEDEDQTPTTKFMVREQETTDSSESEWENPFAA
ncbi:hypothetical protein Tco_1095672, partial [Tanacetum coccineum]